MSRLHLAARMLSEVQMQRQGRQNRRKLACSLAEGQMKTL